MRAIRYIKSKSTRCQFINTKDLLKKRAEKLRKKDVFLGGAYENFEIVGRLQLISLLKIGLYSHSKVLDIGCGCLRGGYWLIHFLNRNCYSGIEPNEKMLNLGKKYIIGSDLIEEKKPRFDTNSDFDFSVFNTKFDYVIARSIWTHSSKKQIETMLESFLPNSTKQGVFLTSYLKGSWYNDYKGNRWSGRSHKSDRPGATYHSYSWIKKQCKKRDLKVKELPFDVFNSQVWLYISKE